MFFEDLQVRQKLYILISIFKENYQLLKQLVENKIKNEKIHTSRNIVNDIVHFYEPKFRQTRNIIK